MGQIQLGKIEKLDLRQVWKHEANDFTGWLAQKENIELLSQEIEIEIDSDSIQTEASVGKFNVDILAQEANTGKKIIIENQLESTNHDHLGKIITYASGLGAEFIIWIVKEARSEHIQAIDWLNEHTDENTNFFLVKMELWKIDSSQPAPKFYVISKPNEWAKTIKTISRGEITETKESQFQFWNKFKEYTNEQGTILRLRKARPQHWYTIGIGSSEAHIALTINTRDKQIACEIYIPRIKELFNKLHENREKIETELGEKLEWMELPEAIASRIKLSRNADIAQTENWEEYFKWLKQMAEKFHKVFSKHVKKIQNQ